MRSDCAPDLSKIVLKKITNLVPTVHDIYTSVDNGHVKNKSSKVQNTKSESNLNQFKRTDIYLKIDVIRKIIDRFLVEKKMSKESLAAALEIRLIDLERIIFHKEIPSTLIPKVNLPLIKLYCETKFEDQLS